MNQLTTISTLDLARVTGGAAKLDFGAIRAQAAQSCPTTAARYAKVDPSTVTRPVAQTMADACLAEMGPFKAMFARGPVQGAIDRAFPKS
jgi:hypothetical protein